jgi:hypothetical protein
MSKIIIEVKELNRIISEEVEKFVEEVESKHPDVLKEKLKTMPKEQLINLLQECSSDSEFILDNVSKYMLHRLYKKSRK